VRDGCGIGTSLINVNSDRGSGFSNHTVAHGTDLAGSTTRHFMPGYHHLVPPGQEPPFFSGLPDKRLAAASLFLDALTRRGYDY